MKYSIRTFGIASDILGGKVVSVEIEGNTIGALRNTLNDRYPALRELKSLYIAINQKYGDDSSVIKESDEIAIIPPVSGG